MYNPWMLGQDRLPLKTPSLTTVDSIHLVSPQQVEALMIKEKNCMKIPGSRQYASM